MATLYKMHSILLFGSSPNFISLYKFAMLFTKQSVKYSSESATEILL